MDDIRQSASNLVDFFEQNKTSESFSFPYSYLYPENCCESVSLIFNCLVKTKYPAAKVRIVGGTNTKYDQHFWLEIDGLVFDLTAHQFENIEAPILGEETSLLKKEFIPDDGQPGHDFIDENTIIALHRHGAFGF